jgi:hypothetical protein
MLRTSFATEPLNLVARGRQAPPARESTFSRPSGSPVSQALASPRDSPRESMSPRHRLVAHVPSLLSAQRESLIFAQAPYVSPLWRQSRPEGVLAHVDAVADPPVGGSWLAGVVPPGATPQTSRRGLQYD